MQYAIPARLCLLLIVLFISSLAFTQPKFPYQFCKNKEIALFSVGVTTAGLGTWWGYRIAPLSAAQVAALDRGGVYPGFDRVATYRFSSRAKTASDILMYSSWVVPTATMMLLPNNREWGRAATIGSMASQTFLITTGLTQLTKNMVKRTRPFAYNPNVPLHYKTERNARQSFFSGHTSTTASMCFFAAEVFQRTHPGSRWRPWVWGAAAAIPAATGILRVQAGKHYPTDVIVGYIVGAACGIFVPRLHLD
jgi:membrane-associated phospholipid phosphatase